jgi:peptide/nickel transport system substrate-binding protein
MKNFFKLKRNFKLPKKNEIKKAISSFSKKERYLFIFLILLLVISTVSLLSKINKYLIVEVPMSGGTLREGIIGSPRLINPVLAITDTDNDLISLVYSGLMRKDSTGNLIPDLAENYEISEDNLSYTFTLKDNIYFHDNEPVKAEDIIFTINEIKNPETKSLAQRSWDGITVEEIDAKTIKFNLKQPYASFLENTTIGILPKHLWINSQIELNDLNINPIGSGPYQIKNMSKQSSGIIDSYELTYFKKFALGKPYIKNIILRFYQNESELISALNNNNVDQISSISANNASLLNEKKYEIKTSVLPRIFALFFNQNQNQLFTNKNVVAAINLGINKERIIEEVLKGYGVIINNPIPPNMTEYQKINKEENFYEKNFKKAESILSKDGWVKNEMGFWEKNNSKDNKITVPLEFSISTGNAPELAQTAELIKEDLAKLGIKVEIKNFEIGNLNQTVIRPRKYDTLLFGQIVNNESDLFAFWHSSQRKDPGRNVAMYTNSKVDKILEDAFITIEKENRIKKYTEFKNEIQKELPAIFLYSPNFIYVTSKDLKGISIDYINSTSGRFSNSYLWYVKTDKVWKIFAK